MSNLISALMKQVDDARKAEFEQTEQLNLGRFIEALRAVRQDLVIVGPDRHNPSRFISWRGIYAELALDYPGKESMTVAELLNHAEKADGSTFTGYKGGDFTMDRSTPVWWDQYGVGDHDAIVGVVDKGEYAEILVKDTDPFGDA